MDVPVGPHGLDLHGPSEFAPRPVLPGDLNARLGGDCLRLGAAAYPSAVLMCVCKTLCKPVGMSAGGCGHRSTYVHTCAYTRVHTRSPKSTGPEETSRGTSFSCFQLPVLHKPVFSLSITPHTFMGCLRCTRPEELGRAE